MDLSVKEKEKYVLQLREAGKTYRDIAHELRMSPREISNILKRANGEMEKKKEIKLFYQILQKHYNYSKMGRVQQK
jgi:transcriptional regulator